MIKQKTIRRRSYRGFGFLGLGIFVMVFLFVFLSYNFGKTRDGVLAVDLGRFQAGYIISDWQMTDYSSMSEADIQNWLISKNPCNNRDYGYYQRLSAGSAYRWHFENGHFVCLSEERFGDNDNEIGFQYGETAAHIIWQAAQDYRINPKVLLVLLQKETGLITDPIPNNGDYRKATGYGCPDTAVCSSRYYGFKNQVRNAAYLFRIVMDGNSSYYPIGNNYIQYNPNAGCGGSVVNIRNLATSALYRYTPYQPNQGALNAGYGTAFCGAYGNRNFYSYFEDWFGGILDEHYVEPVVEAKTEFKRTIEDGTYQLVPKSDPNKAIDVYGGVFTNTTLGVLQSYVKKVSDMSNQLFRIEYDESNGYYSLVNPTSNLAFDVEHASTANSARVLIYSQNSGCNQDWLLEKDDEGYYTIVSRCSNKALDAAIDGRIIIYSRHGGDNQKWQLVRVAGNADRIETFDGEYRISPRLDLEKVIDVYGGVSSGMSSGILQIYEKKKKDVNNQVFEIKYNSKTGYYNIVNSVSGLAFDVEHASTANSARVLIYSQNSGCNQDWLLEKDDEGYYTIVSRCSNKALDAAIDGRIIIYSRHGGDNQKWQLVRF